MSDLSPKADVSPESDIAVSVESKAKHSGDASTADKKNSTTQALVDVLMKPTGDVPILKQTKWTVRRNMKVHEIVYFIKVKVLHLDPSDSLFFFVNQAFAPALDEDVGNLFDCFQTNNRLVLHYAKTQAWG